MYKNLMYFKNHALKRNFQFKKTHFTKTKSHEKTLQINFSHQKVTVENKYYYLIILSLQTKMFGFSVDLF